MNIIITVQRTVHAAFLQGTLLKHSGLLFSSNAIYVTCPILMLNKFLSLTSSLASGLAIAPTNRNNNKIAANFMSVQLFSLLFFMQTCELELLMPSRPPQFTLLFLLPTVRSYLYTYQPRYVKLFGH